MRKTLAAWNRIDKDVGNSTDGITESQQEPIKDYVGEEYRIDLLTKQITKTTAKLEGY